MLLSVTPKPLADCPVCRYALTGLPSEHRCPECGFDDTRTLGFRPRGLLYFWSWLAIALGCSAVILLIVFGQLWEWSSLAATAPVWANILYFTYLLYFHRPFIAVGPFGLTFRPKIGPTRSVPWSQLRIDEASVIHVTFRGLKPVRLAKVHVLSKGEWSRAFLPLEVLSPADRIVLSKEIFRRWEMCNRQVDANRLANTSLAGHGRA